jgi:cytochrome c5
VNARILARLVLPFVVLSGSGIAQGEHPAVSVELPGPAELDRLAAESVSRWEASPHGQMLLRILPRRLEPSALPEQGSAGAQLVGLYCVQCHHLPNPAMHDAANWPRIVERMLPRMRGEGNMGALMAAMMRGPGAGSASSLKAPSAAQAAVIIDYLERHAMRPLDPRASPKLREALSGYEGRMFVEACSQCHVLPDPAAHSADEWPAIVNRMAQNMQWMNRVASTPDDPREPQLRLPQIVDFLRRHAGGRAGNRDSPRLR